MSGATMNTPQVSLIVPTRDRPQQLLKSLYGLCNACTDRSRVEVVLHIANDDVQTLQVISDIANYAHPGLSSESRPSCIAVTAVVGSRDSDPQRVYADCASKARGRLLLLWSDDGSC